MAILKRFLHFWILVLLAPIKYKTTIIKSYGASHAQLHQDLFALMHNNFKRDGFFVEFGAVDGLYLSNTLLLDCEYGWRGILLEPHLGSHPHLQINRPKCIIDNRIVWSASGETIDFNENNDPALSGVLDPRTQAKDINNNTQLYSVITVSLADLLFQHKAPHNIDFLSIDTEGTEWIIIKDFDFSAYEIKVVCIEHNYGPTRQAVFEKMIQHGYVRKYRFISRFDDWYVKV